MKTVLFVFIPKKVISETNIEVTSDPIDIDFYWE